MSASMTDILTTQKNGVIGVNGIGQTLSNLYTLLNNKIIGTKTQIITASTLIRVGAGVLVSATTVKVGATDGAAFDCINVAAADTTNYTNSIANLAKGFSATGNYVYGCFYTTGLVIVPGTNQVIAVTYSVIT